MELWALVPLPAAAALLLLAGVAAARRGEPRGRWLLPLMALAGAVSLGCMARIQHAAPDAVDPLTARGAWMSTIFFGTLWAAFAAFFGRGPGRTTATDGFAVAVAVAAAPVLILCMLAYGGPGWKFQAQEGWLVTLDTGPARALAGFLLLVGAFGILRFHALREAARATRRKRLRRAAAGPLLASLGIFLVASQTLLYGSSSLRVLSIASLCAVPASLFALPIFLRRSASEAALPEGAAPAASSIVLLGLGFFLISLAVLGQAVQGFLPSHGVVWYHWGGVILLFGLGSAWMIPGLREPLKRAFDSSSPIQGDPHWQWARSNQAMVPTDSPAELAQKVSELVEELLRGTGSVLWVRSAGGNSMIPVSPGNPAVGPLHADNPLRQALSRAPYLCDLSQPPTRVAQVPLHAENLDLIEAQGLRIFLALRVGDEELGVLGLAPSERWPGAEARRLLENLSGQLANVLWGMRYLNPGARCAGPEAALADSTLRQGEGSCR